jgi:membrane associated rhomboid family serine protease
MFTPYRADVPMSRLPIANWILIGITVLFFFLTEGLPEHTVSSMILGNSVWAWPGHLLLHAGLWHLLGNMIFLWVFGNAICAKAGNLFYLPLYVALGLFAAATHMLFDGGPAVGASGAINGIVGMFLIWYPLNSVSCAYFIFLIPRTFSVSSFWVILLWLAFDVLGAISGSGGIAYYAHLGGFFAGVGVGVLLLLSEQVTMEYGERSLLAVLGLAREPEPPWRRDYLQRGGAAFSGPRGTRLFQRRAGRRSSDYFGSDATQIRFRCACGRVLKAPLIYAGKRTRCPYCNAPIQVPSAPDPNA